MSTFRTRYRSLVNRLAEIEDYTRLIEIEPNMLPYIYGIMDPLIEEDEYAFIEISLQRYHDIAYRN